MAQLTDDCFAFGGKLMSGDAALALLRGLTIALPAVETVPLGAALGRILAEDVVSGVAVPPHDNAAVDGFAVRHEDLDPAADTVLPIMGRVAAGHGFAAPVPPGQALRIFTGAPMPEGPDTVVMQEDCVVAGRDVRIRPGIKRGANRRRAGEDVGIGSLALPLGRRLRPQEIGLAAAIGRTELPVYRPLRAALLSTGDELREPGEPLSPGTIYDANRHTLKALLQGLGCTVTDLGIAPDDPSAIRHLLAEAASSHDLVVTSGGMSTGEEDHVGAAVEALGSLHFWRLAIKPGRPVALGQIERIPFIGLPGNPVAVMVTFLTLARPLILRLAGAVDILPRQYRVRADFGYRKKPDRREYIRVSVRPDESGGLVATKYARDGAGILSSMVASDGLVVLTEGIGALEAGSMVDYIPFSEVLG